MTHRIIVRYNEEMRRSAVVLSVFFAVLIASLYALAGEKFFRPHDFLQGARTVEMATLVSEFVIPPRWSENFGYGYGMPLFQFYAPFPSYVSSSLYLLGFSLVSSVKVLYLLSTVLAFIGMYLLGKNVLRWDAGLLASILFVLAPYRAVNLFVRGAISESFAMATYPWIFLGIVLIIKNKPYGSLVLWTSLIVLMLSHNVSTVLFFPFVGLFIVANLFLERRCLLPITTAFKKLLTILLSSFAAVLAAAYYVVPAFLEKSFTQVDERIVSGYFDYENHFVYVRQLFTSYWGYGGSVPGPEDGISFFIGYPQIFAILIALLITMYQVSREFFKKKVSVLALLSKRKIALTAFFGFASFFSLFMTLRYSSFLWENIAIIRYAQFPWRWLGIASFFIALFASASVLWIKNKIIISGIIATILFATVLLNYSYFKPEQYLLDNSDYYFSDSDRIQVEMSPILPDYYPKTFTKSSPSPSFLMPVNGSQLAVFSYEIIDKNATNVEIVANTSENLIVEAAVAAYPGWKVYINSEKTEYTVSADGAIQFPLDSGRNTVEIVLNKTQVQTVSDIASVVGLLLFGMISVLRRYHYL